MFILTIYGKESEGVYAVVDADGDKILYLFEEEDDAIRYALLLEENEYPNSVLLKTCKLYSYRYTIITKNDIVIPPKQNDNF